MKSTKKSDVSAQSKNLLFVNYYFPPMGGGGVQRITKLLKYIDHARYRISVLTVKNSYFYSADESLLKEIPQSVTIFRSGSLDPFRVLYLIQKAFRAVLSKQNSGSQLPKESGALIRRVANTVFIPDSRILWMPFAIGRILRLRRHERPNTIVASMPPFTTACIGALAAKLIGCKLVLDFRDAWLQNPYLPMQTRVHARVSRYLERYCIRRANGIIFVNPALQQLYESRYPELAEVPTITVRNGYDEADMKAVDQVDCFRDGNRFQLGIMGSVYSQGNRPQSLFQALAELCREDPEFGDRFELVMLGKWAGDFLKWMGRLGIEEIVRLIPYKPHAEALGIAAEFDALTLSVESTEPGSEAVTPGRIYEYLRLKKPVLAICPKNSDLAHLVASSEAGRVVEYNDIAEIKTVLQRWVAAGNQLGVEYAFKDLEQYSRKYLAARFADFVDGV